MNQIHALERLELIVVISLDRFNSRSIWIGFGVASFPYLHLIERFRRRGDLVRVNLTT